MRRSIKSILVILMLCVAVVTAPMSAQVAEATTPSVTNKQVYWLTGYRSGGYCVLSANIYMIRRAMIARGSTKWSKVTYKTAGRALCTSVPGMKWHYKFTSDGVTVRGEHIRLTGTPSQKAAKLRKMLKKHPEGVVVRGSRLSGYPHGALLTGYYGKGRNQFYVADSTNNVSRFVKHPKGITTWGKSTLNDVKNVQDVWYLKSVKGIAKSARSTFIKIGSKKYYINKYKKKARGLTTIHKKTYYFSKKDGHMMKGWVTVSGKRYYFSKKTGAAYKGVRKKINGKYYTFSKSGALVVPKSPAVGTTPTVPDPVIDNPEDQNQDNDTPNTDNPEATNPDNEGTGEGVSESQE